MARIDETATERGVSRSTAYRYLRSKGVYPIPKLIIPKDELERLYCVGEKTPREIAKIFGCERTVIMDRLRYYRIDVRNQFEAERLAAKQGKIGKRGNTHHNWKGGRRLDGHGYVLVYAPNNPRSNHNFILEHILVWETVHQQPLPKGWLIHHLNGNKADNCPENLVASPSKNHRDFITALQERIHQLEKINDNSNNRNK